MKKIKLLILTMLFGSLSFSQTSLSAGDIVIVGMNCDNPDEFAFVPLIDLEIGTVIRFTDDGWLSEGGFRSGEGGVEYTSPSSISWGTVIIFTSPASGDWAVNNTGLGGSFSLSADGDQIIAFQGDASTPTVVYAVNNYGAGVWQSDATSSNESALPTGLTNGNNAIALNELDNYAYTGGPNSDPTTLRNLVSDNSNWTGSNTTRQSMPSSPLPVELSSFSASIINNGVRLNWRTETEVNNYGFEIFRAVYTLAGEDQSNEWSLLGFVEGHGNSNSPKEYSFIDDEVTSGKYAYRLKQIDNDGTFEYSKIIEIDVDVPLEFELSQNYPNPFNPSTTINYSLPVTSKVKLSVFNILGEEVQILINETKDAGTYVINFSAIGGSAFGGNAYTFPSGIYFYRLQAGDFIKVKKMILLK